MKHRANGANGPDVQRLLRQASKGDSEAFGKLYEAYMEPVYRYALLRVGDERAAEMITEETFVEGWLALPDYRQRPGNSFIAWLFRIARNLVIDFLYEHRQFDEFEEPISAEPSSGSNGHVNLDWFTSDALLPRELLEAIRGLSDIEQDVAILALVERLPLPVIASIIRRNPKSCRQVQKRALAKLIKLYNFQAFDDPFNDEER
jgi:RNA polymerase sigma-70 factor (ECF subfamily)